MNNPNLITDGQSTRFRPGLSGNPNGRPVGSRQVFSAGFLKDFAEVWQAHGKDTMLHTAKTQPTTFFAVCARLIPSDVKLTVEQTYGELDPILRAIKESLPAANSESPQAVLEFVRDAVQAAAAQTTTANQDRDGASCHLRCTVFGCGRPGMLSPAVAVKGDVDQAEQIRCLAGNS